MNFLEQWHDILLWTFESEYPLHFNVYSYHAKILQFLVTSFGISPYNLLWRQLLEIQSSRFNFIGSLLKDYRLMPWK